MPQRGDVYRLEERCSICERTPRLKVTPFRGRPWDLCLNDDCPSMQEMKRRRAEREAAKAAKEALAKVGEGDGEGNGKTALDTKPRRVKRARAPAKAKSKT